jgi:branched-chain amino acid transport system permease protein
MTDSVIPIVPVITGILLGGLFAMIALGLSLVFGVMKLINVAHGDLVILASYIAWVLVTAFGFDPILSLLIIAPVMFGLGWLIQRFLLNRAFRISMEAAFLITLAISLIIQNSIQLIWGAATKGISSSYSLQGITLGAISIPLIYVINFIVSLFIIFSLNTFLRRTYLGMAITASSQHEKAALLMGIDTTRIYVFTFGLGMSVAAISGVLVGQTFPFEPSSGISYLIIAFSVVIMGGLGSMVGTLIAGMVFGLATTLGGYFLGAYWQSIIAYLIVLVVLFIKPQGLFMR